MYCSVPRPTLKSFPSLFGGGNISITRKEESWKAFPSYQSTGLCEPYMWEALLGKRAMPLISEEDPCCAHFEVPTMTVTTLNRRRADVYNNSWGKNSQGT